MKKLSVLLFGGLCFLSACTRDFESGITGRWQLNRIDFTDREVYTDSVYYSFHLDVFQLQLRRQNDIYMSSRMWGMYSIVGDSLYISLRDENDISGILGWQEFPSKYKIEELSRMKLTLSSHDIIYHFRKF